MTVLARIYLDIDGALSPLPNWEADNPESFPETGWSWQLARYGGYRVPLPLELIAGLRVLASGGVEIVWASTWLELADKLLNDAGGAPGWRHLELDFGAPSPKLAALRAEIRADPAPFVWVDDQAITASARGWARDCGVASRLCRPYKYAGWTRRSVVNTLGWLTRTVPELGALDLP